MNTFYMVGNNRTKAAPIGATSSLSAKARLASKDATRFNQFWALMETVHVHGYVRAAMSVIGRSAIGGGWSLVKSREFSDDATERQRKRLLRFYMSLDRPWDNIKDFQGTTYKLMIGASYLRYFGQAAYQILRNAEDVAVGWDFLPGYVVPNVDSQGYFVDPNAAFLQYPTKNSSTYVPFQARDVVFITNPDWEGAPVGGSDSEALTDYTLPLDIYLQTAAREYMKNRDRPEAFYILPSDVSDDAFNAFVSSVETMYSGPTNVGRSPITVAGDLEIKELSRLPSDLPYQEARKDTRQELLAVSGVTGAKLGLTDSLSSANLRESRREFHETTMIPLFRLLEAGFYEQVHVREFGIRGWEMKFNSPDFLTAVERATVDMRYYQIGALSPNEIRQGLGRPARTDELGDRFRDEAQEGELDTDNPQGSPPEGREDRPDSPANIGEPADNDAAPVRGDQHDEEVRNVLGELRRWKAFAHKRFKKGEQLSRDFSCEYIPPYLAEEIRLELSKCGSASDVQDLFGSVISMINEEMYSD